MRFAKLAVVAVLTVAPITGVVLSSAAASAAPVAAAAPASAHAHPDICRLGC